MCGRGSLCAYCSRPAIASVHWPSWAVNLCGVCLSDLKKDKEPELIVMIEEDGDATAC